MLRGYAALARGRAATGGVCNKVCCGCVTLKGRIWKVNAMHSIAPSFVDTPFGQFQPPVSGFKPVCWCLRFASDGLRASIRRWFQPASGDFSLVRFDSNFGFRWLRVVSAWPCWLRLASVGFGLFQPRSFGFRMVSAGIGWFQLASAWFPLAAVGFSLAISISTWFCWLRVAA